MQTEEITDLKFITLAQVIEKVSLGGSTILRWEKLGQFPDAVRLSSTKRVWLRSDIDRWMLEKKKSRSRITVVTA
jgi:predicted DNA-binding transcriptional regulator AlpA